MKKMYKILLSVLVSQLLFTASWAQSEAKSDKKTTNESPININTANLPADNNNLVVTLKSNGTSSECHLDDNYSGDEEKYVNVKVYAAPMSAKNNLTLNGTTYTFLQCHFHLQSEHTLNKKAEDMEAHFVFQDTVTKGLVVIGVFMKKGGKDNSFFATVLTQFEDLLDPKKSDNSHGSDFTINLNKLDGNTSLTDYAGTYYNYDGSLTTPPFTKGVQWFVSQKKMSISNSQYTQFKQFRYKYSSGKKYPIGYARHVQPLGNRTVTSKTK